MRTLSKLLTKAAITTSILAGFNLTSQTARSEPAFTQNENNKSAKNKETEYSTKWWEYPLNLTGGYLITVAWHELAHFNVAHVVGCKDINFEGPSKAGVAAVNYKCSQDSFTQTLISSSGFTATTFGSVALTTLLAKEVVPNNLRSYTATTSLIMMLDRHRYLWSTAIQNYARMDIPPGNDVHKIMRINLKNQQDIDYFYGFSLATSVAELALRHEEIGYLINTAIGKKEKPLGINTYIPSVQPTKSGFNIGIQGNF